MKQASLADRSIPITLMKNRKGKMVVVNIDKTKIVVVNIVPANTNLGFNVVL